jgi:protein arginine N-methyltransferase 1
MPSYLTDPRMSYGPEEIWFAASLYVLSWEQDFHTLMLNDHVRMVAYERAIKAAVRPGMAVLDLGTGTGILAAWALEAGARVVHGIDVNTAILAEAQARIERAGFGSRFHAWNALSYDVNLPERVDLIISEILGNLGDNEGMTPILNDARLRFLKPGGRMLPRRARTFLVPVSALEAHRQIEQRSCRGLSASYDLDRLLVQLQVPSPFQLYFDAIIPARAHLAPPAVAASFAFDGRDPEEYVTSLSFTAQKDGTLTGFKGTFAAELLEGVVLDIGGDDIAARATSDSWKHCYLPIERPLAVRAGEIIDLRYARARPAPVQGTFRPLYSWSGSVRRGDQVLGSFHSTMA